VKSPGKQPDDLYKFKPGDSVVVDRIAGEFGIIDPFDPHGVVISGTCAEYPDGRGACYLVDCPEVPHTLLVKEMYLRNA